MSAENILQNQYFLGYIGGPIAGVFYSWLFGNIAVKQQKIKEIWIHHVSSPSPKPKGSAGNSVSSVEEVWLYILFAAVVVAVSSFFIVLFFDPTSQAISTLSIFLSLFTAFGILTNFLVSREIHTPYMVLLFVSASIFLLINFMADSVLAPYANYANSLAAHYYLDDISSIINSIVAFYSGLSGTQIAYFLLLIIAYVFIFLTSIVALFVFLFYSITAQLKPQSSQFAWKIARFTHKYSRVGYLWFMIVSILFAFLTFKGVTFIYGLKALHALARFSR
uniref:Uncharacterized protein n=1 Tax=mine drainage metagenome TaxID=410659 RepID=E6QGN5_9ZZZZ